MAQSALVFGVECWEDIGPREALTSSLGGLRYPVDYVLHTGHQPSTSEYASKVMGHVDEESGEVFSQTEMVSEA